MASSFAELESQTFENNDIAVLKAVLAKPMEARQPHELLAVANLLQNLNYFKIGVNDKKERLDFALKCSKYLKYSFFPKGYEVVRRDDAGTDFFIIYKGETHVFIPKGPKEFEEDFSNTHKKLAYEDYLAFAKRNVEHTSYTSLPNGTGKEEPRRSGTVVRAETLGEVHLVHHKSKGAALRAKALDPESGIFNGPPEHDLTFDEKLLLLNNKANTYFLQGTATYKKVSILRSGDSFGELALLFNQPRTASVIASEDLHVLTLASSNYKGIFESEISNLWKKIDFFRTTFDDLSSLMIAKFCYLLEEKKLTHNEIIYKEHDDADGIYIVKEGEVQLSKYIEVEENVVNHVLEKKLPASRRKIIVANLQKGSFFGESEVIHQCTREYTAMSSSINTLVYRISKQAYMSSIQVYFSTIDNFLHQKAIFNENVRKQWLKKQQDILLSETGAQSERKNRKDYFGLDDYQFSNAKKGVTYVKRSQLLNQNVTIQKVQDPALYIKEDTNIDAISLMSTYLHKPGSPSKRLKPVVEVGTPVSPRKNRVRGDEKASPSSPRPAFLVPRIPLKDEKPTITKLKEPEDFSYYLLPKLKTATSFANSPANALLQSQTLESSRRDIEESPYIDITQRKSPVKEINSIAKLELNDLPISINTIKNMHTAMRRQAGDGSPSSRSPRKATFRQSPTALRGISDYCFSAADTYVKQTPRKPVTEKKKSPTKIERSNTLHNVMLSPMVIQRVDHEYVDGDKLLSHRYSGGRLTHTRHNMFRTFKNPS